jgi:hypothetical protein
MSPLGQKQTYAVQNGMSALHPKADMCSAVVHVRFGPIADIAPVSGARTHDEAVTLLNGRSIPAGGICIGIFAGMIAD